MHHPRGTDIPGQGGGVGITIIKTQTVCIIPVVLISPVRVVVLCHFYKDTDRMHHPRGTDIPGQSGGVGITIIKIQTVCIIPVVLISPVRVVVLVVAPLVNLIPTTPEAGAMSPVSV